MAFTGTGDGCIARRATRDDGELARYWQTDYNWRKFETRLNALPQFMTTIDGVDIHFIHVRSKHPNALPVIVTHGWPGSIIEQLKIIDPLTNPTAHGGTLRTLSTLSIPSLPGYGFSGTRHARLGSHSYRPRLDRADDALGYTRYVAQGGDWGNAVTEQMALLAPPELVGIHTNMPATVPDDIAKALQSGSPPPSGLSADEQYAYDQLDFFYKHGLAYAQEMAQPSADAVRDRGFTDRPRRLDARPRRRSYAMIARVFAGQPEGLTRTTSRKVTLYWLTNTGVSSARLYWESKLPSLLRKALPFPLPSALFRTRSTRPAELDRKSLSQANSLQPPPQRRALAAWEQPALFVEEMRTSFRSLRQA